MKLHDNFHSSLLKGFEVQGVRGTVIRQCGWGGGKCALNSYAHSLYGSESTRLWSLSSEVFPDKNLSRCHSNTRAHFINITSFTADFEEEVFKNIFFPLKVFNPLWRKQVEEYHLLRLSHIWRQVERKGRKPSRRTIFKRLSLFYHLNWMQTEVTATFFSNSILWD